MTQIYGLATLWIGLELIATLLSIWLRIAIAMSEIIVGTVAQLIIGAALGATALGTDQSWIKFLASTGAVLLTFLAGRARSVGHAPRVEASRDCGPRGVHRTVSWLCGGRALCFGLEQ